MSEPGNHDSGAPPDGKSDKGQRGDGEPKRRRRRRRRQRDADGTAGAERGAADGAQKQTADEAGRPAGRARRRGARQESKRRRRDSSRDAADGPRGDDARSEPRRRRRRRGSASAEAEQRDKSDSPASETTGAGDAEEGRRRRRRRSGEARGEARSRSKRGTRGRAREAEAHEDRPGKRRRRRRRRGPDEGRDDSHEHRTTASDPETEAPEARTAATADIAARVGREIAAPGTEARAPGAAGIPGPEPVLPADEASVPDHDEEFADFILPVAELIPDPDSDDPDPVSHELELCEVDENRALETGVRNLVGVKFTATGRIFTFDAGNRHYRRGDKVIVEGERGTRRGIIAIPPHRRVHSGKPPKRVLRSPNERDLESQARIQMRSERAFARARTLARDLAMPIKVYRAEFNSSNKKLLVYFTSEERVDFRSFVKRLSSEVDARVEMRQTGVRDEAKSVGGIGSCGMELCCTTWLPEFVPVSIKMAKDQGLVLNPTKVSGQCGRLKCCLVYEQETYAAMRKGLPKLGKRVITESGEGRVVEVDVLRQRVRVALGPGEFQIFPGHEVKPKFPPQQPKPRKT